MYEILLCDDLAFRLDRVDDAPIEHCVNNCDVAGNFDRADVHAIELIETLCALECADEALA